MKTRTKLILGILAGLLTIGFIPVWELVIKENIESVEVVIVQPGAVLHPNDEILSKHLATEKRNRATLVEGYVKPEEMNSLIGKTAKQTLVGNQIISMRYIDMNGFTPDPKKGESIRPIPNQWLYALPATVRRHDRIDVYLLRNPDAKPDENEVVQSVQNTYVGTSPEQDLANEQSDNKLKEEDKAYQEQREAIANNKKIPLIQNFVGSEDELLNYVERRDAILKEQGLNESSWEALVLKGDIPLLVDVPVAYAKDNSGNEIQSTTGETVTKVEKDERLTANGTITNLELLLDENDHRLLMNYVQHGYLLYITYN